MSICIYNAHKVCDCSPNIQCPDSLPPEIVVLNTVAWSLILFCTSFIIASVLLAG